MCVSDTGNVPLRTACIVRYYICIRSTVHALRKTTLPVSDAHMPLYYNTFKVIQ